MAKRQNNDILCRAVFVKKGLISNLINNYAFSLFSFPSLLHVLVHIKVKKVKVCTN